MQAISLKTFIINICIIVLCFTIVRSILIMIVGKNLFTKAKINVNSSYYPILNLFTLLEITNLSLFYGILFFIPILNLIPLMLTSYKLGKSFNVNTFDLLGLLFLPFIFYITVFKKDYKYKIEDQKYFEALDSVKLDSVLLLTDEELNDINKSSEKHEEVDSIFKDLREVQIKEDVSPYKALNMNNNAQYVDNKNNIEKNEINDIEVVDL